MGSGAVRPAHAWKRIRGQVPTGEGPPGSGIPDVHLPGVLWGLMQALCRDPGPHGHWWFVRILAQRPGCPHTSLWAPPLRTAPRDPLWGFSATGSLGFPEDSPLWDTLGCGPLGGPLWEVEGTPLNGLLPLDLFSGDHQSQGASVTWNTRGYLAQRWGEAQGQWFWGPSVLPQRQRMG